MKRLITFTGTMGSGKSTAIEVLKDLREDIGPTILVKFAAPLYDIQEYIYDRISSVYQRPDNFIKDRKLLQFIGTEWGRNTIFKSIWGDIWEQQVKEHLGIVKKDFWTSNPNNIVVCDDVRFDNEAERVKNMGGIIIKIESDKTQERIDTQSGIPQHASEAGVNLKYVDYIVTNNGTLKEFQTKLYDLYKVILDN